MKKIAVLSGAGISAESGLKTFRDAGGLWEGHNVNQVATPQAWSRNRKLVLKFYNERRRQLKNVSPNTAHLKISELQDNFHVVVITQNVDNLHEKAGNKNVIHLHGELTKVRSTADPNLVYDWYEDLNEGDLCDHGSQLRPHIVWFGEPVPMLEEGVHQIMNSDIAIIVGTSMQVYPAASLIAYAPRHCEIYYIDPKPHISYELARRTNIRIVQDNATAGMKKVVKEIKEKFT